MDGARCKNIFDLTTKYRVQLRDLYVTQAVGHGIAAFTHSKPELINSPHHSITRVISRFNGGAGVYIENGYAIHFDQSFAGDNGSSGFHLAGFHTSLKFSLCGASNNADGFFLTNAVYCSFDTCHTDDNRLHGYNIGAAAAIGFRSCGGERNARAMFLLPERGQRQLFGIKVQECFGVDNGGGQLPSFIEAAATGGFRADITVEDCFDMTSPSGRSIFVNDPSAVTLRRVGGWYAGAA